MHLPLFFLLAIPLALALPSSHLPSAFAHLLPSIPGTEAEILEDAIATLTAQSTAVSALPVKERARWQLFGVRAASAGEEWSFIAVHLRPEYTENQGVLAVAPGAEVCTNSKLGWVVKGTRHHLVPLKAFFSLDMILGAPGVAAKAYLMNSPQDLRNWYDQFFRAMDIDVSQRSGAE